MFHPSKTKFSHWNQGLTLVEVLVTTLIGVIVLMAITMFGRDIFINNYSMQKSLVAEEEAKSAMNRMMAELRNASQASNGAYPIELASTTDVIFYGDIDQDGVRERVRYYLGGKTLKRGVVRAQGQPVTYPANTETVSTLANNMINQLVFSYYDRSYDGTSSSSPLSQPVAVQNVRLVKVELSIDADPNRSPVPLYLTSQVMLRSLKDNW